MVGGDDDRSADEHCEDHAPVDEARCHAGSFEIFSRLCQGCEAFGCLDVVFAEGVAIEFYIVVKGVQD